MGCAGAGPLSIQPSSGAETSELRHKYHMQNIRREDRASAVGSVRDRPSLLTSRQGSRLVGSLRRARPPAGRRPYAAHRGRQ
eukprot:scaffold55906_cov27-Tisochrysis_lutea.AAC.2